MLIYCICLRTSFQMFGPVFKTVLNFINFNHCKLQYEESKILSFVFPDLLNNTAFFEGENHWWKLFFLHLPNNSVKTWEYHVLCTETLQEIRGTTHPEVNNDNSSFHKNWGGFIIWLLTSSRLLHGPSTHYIWNFVNKALSKVV